MISKSLSSVTLEDLEALIDSQVREGKSIEYKRELPGKGASETEPFLAGVSSFANASGGDFILGIAAKDGLPTSIDGLEIPNLDGEILRLENILRNGLEPRISIDPIHPIEVEDNRYVLIIRVKKSWNSPHRVIANRHFYGRNSAGRYALDVSELRTMFTLSEQIADRIRAFRSDRIRHIATLETPVPILKAATLVLHIVPLTAFSTREFLDISKCYQDASALPPLGRDGWSSRINLDGILTFNATREGPSIAYTQLFRTGIVEALYVFEPRKDHRIIPSTWYERNVIEGVSRYLQMLSRLDVVPPLFVYLSFLRIKDYRLLYTHGRFGFNEDSGTDRDQAMLPEVVIEEHDVDYGRSLRPLFDMVSNAFGLERSFNFDDDGNWIEPR